MLLDAFVKLHEQIRNESLGKRREDVIREVEEAALSAIPTSEMPRVR